MCKFNIFIIHIKTLYKVNIKIQKRNEKNLTESAINLPRPDRGGTPQGLA